MEQLEGEDGRVWGGSRELANQSNAVEEDDKQLQYLGSDLLVDVLSYLPQKDLFEVMLVSQDWNTAVTESAVLWRKVNVVKKWGSGESGLIFKFLGVAEEVRIPQVRKLRRYEECVMSAGGWLGPNLRHLTLSSNCVLPTFYPLLAEQCPHLKSLVVFGNVAKGSDLFRMSHPTLEFLRFSERDAFRVTIDCPSLTRLCMESVGSREITKAVGIVNVDQFNFPALTALTLGSLYCVESILRVIAAHTPNLRELEVSLPGNGQFTGLTHFSNLRVLKVECFDGNVPFPSDAFDSFALLESLELNCCEFASHLMVAGLHLTSLRINDSYRLLPTIIFCPTLEHLMLVCDTFQARCVENINVSCPKLKRLVIGREAQGHFVDFSEWVEVDEVDGPLKLVHERVEEVELQNLSRDGIKVSCKNLLKLVMCWRIDKIEVFNPSYTTFTTPTVDCPRLTSLEVGGYADTLHGIAQILPAAPSLQKLKISCARENSIGVVFEHENVRRVEISTIAMELESTGGETKSKRLTLIMSRLVKVEVVESSKRVLEVVSDESKTVKYTRHIGK